MLQFALFLKIFIEMGSFQLLHYNREDYSASTSLRHFQSVEDEQLENICDL